MSKIKANRYENTATTDGGIDINTSGLVGIGTSSPNQRLTVGAGSGPEAIVIQSGSGNTGELRFTDTGSSGYQGAVVYNHPSSFMEFMVNSSSRMKIDSSGRVGIGIAPSSSPLEVLSGTSNSSLIEATGASAGRGLKISTYANTANDAGVLIEAPYSTYGQLAFGTAGSERMRIKGNGTFYFNTGGGAPNASTSGIEFGNSGYIYNVVNSGTVQYINRNGNDGALVEFRQANQAEGTISVSGSTVSYNGGHLSRWSQLASGAARTEILRGSVLSNLDEMCEWGEEDNEQLNRMKVSETEGDKNVSGVFQAWDDDDDTYTNDFYCAMTGDFVIRIAQGTTVARGDLLMSAGDGTAKPQDDDIVRSKTIAKVTSTTVSETYSDNSYCVPCVLMAC